MTRMGPITEMNVGIDGGDDGWVRVVMLDDDENMASFLIEKDVAEGAALEMSPDVIHRDWIDDDGE